MKAENLLAPVDIEIKLKNRTLSKRVWEAKGGPSSPLRMEEVKEKFRVCSGRILSSEKVEKAIDLVSSDKEEFIDTNKATGRDIHGLVIISSLLSSSQ